MTPSCPLPRAVGLLAPLLAVGLLWAAPAAAQDALRGQVVVRQAGGVAIRVGDTLTPVHGPLSGRLALFRGHEVEVSGRAGADGFQADLLVQPQEAIAPASLQRREDGSAWIVTPQGSYRASGRVDLLDAERRRALLWVFEGREGEAPLALVEAVEAETTGWWTLLRALPRPLSRPRGLIRGAHRSVWLVAQRDGWALVRRGDREGWLRADRIEAVTPPPPPAKQGIIGALRD